MAFQILVLRRARQAGALLIQCAWRRYKANKEVGKRLKRRQRNEALKQKELDLKFQNKKKAEAEIENYIEGLFNKEVGKRQGEPIERPQS